MTRSPFEYIPGGTWVTSPADSHLVLATAANNWTRAHAAEHDTHQMHVMVTGRQDLDIAYGTPSAAPSGNTGLIYVPQRAVCRFFKDAGQVLYYRVGGSNIEGSILGWRV